MKSIELTSDQQVKLMEMSTRLFPEYKTIHITNGSCDYCLEGTLKISKKERPNHNDWVLIHWFEFCMTHLPIAMFRYAMHKCNIQPDIAMKIITNNLLQLEDFDRYYINPIDYLYREFKKLKPV